MFPFLILKSHFTSLAIIYCFSLDSSIIHQELFQFLVHFRMLKSAVGFALCPTIQTNGKGRAKKKLLAARAQMCPFWALSQLVKCFAFITTLTCKNLQLLNCVAQRIWIPRIIRNLGHLLRYWRSYRHNGKSLMGAQTHRVACKWLSGTTNIRKYIKPR